MNHFSYPLTIVQISIFEEPQNIFSNQNLRPQTIEPALPPPVFLTVECPPGPKGYEDVYVQHLQENCCYLVILMDSEVNT